MALSKSKKRIKAIVDATRALTISTGKKFSLYKDVVIHSLDYDLGNITELFAFWAMETERLQSKVGRLELNLERLEAELDIEIRRKIVKGKIPKLTEAGIKHRIRLNKEYSKIEDELLIARRNHRYLLVAKMSMSMKKDVLQSIAANRRKELDDKSLMVKSHKGGDI